MTLDQGLAFGIVAVMMGLFVWGRLRYDLVALLALLASIAVGIVPADQAFIGFGDDIVVIVASALLVSAAVAKSGIAERLISPLAPHLVTVQRQILVLVGVVTLLSAFVKNVGALAMMMPIAFQLARRTGTSPSSLLMPMAFGSLLGGTDDAGRDLAQRDRGAGCAPSCWASRSRCSTSCRSARASPRSGSLSSCSATACCRPAAKAALRSRRRSTSMRTPPRRRYPRIRHWQASTSPSWRR